MPEQWTPEWSIPVFSLVERERRWGKVRELMGRAGIDVVVCLPNTNRKDRGQQDARYLTQLGEGGEETTVVFPLGGEVTAWQTRAGPTPSSNWLTDIRAADYGVGAGAVIPRLKEVNFDRGTIGICGLTGGLLGNTRTPEGTASKTAVEMIERAFPNARIVSATDILGEARYPKSEEEIEFLRKGTEVAEKTSAAIVEHARAGVSERQVFAEMLYANMKAGGSYPPMFGWISGPLGNTYTRVEQAPFRDLRTGDVLMLEIEGRWAGYVAQIDEGYHVGPAHQDFVDGQKLAWEGCQRVFDVMKPGATVGEMVEAGNVIGMNGRGRGSLTAHARGTGDDGPMITGRGLRMTPQIKDLPLVEGACFVVKSYVSVDGKADYGRWADTVVVRKHGAERLGTRPQQIIELG